MIKIKYINNGLYEIKDNHIKDLIGKIEKCFNLEHHHCQIIDWCLRRNDGYLIYHGADDGDWEHFRLEFLEIIGKLDLASKCDGVDIELLIKVEED